MRDFCCHCQDVTEQRAEPECEFTYIICCVCGVVVDRVWNGVWNEETSDAQET